MKTADALQKITEIERSEKPESEKLIETRAVLADISPGQVIKLFYGRSVARPRLLREVLLGLPSRRSLLGWVYGDHVLTVALDYVRFPSLSKRMLVRALLRHTRKRDPWLNSRVLHAFAFRPDYFARLKKDKLKPRRKPLDGAEMTPRIVPYVHWGALYKKASIPRVSQNLAENRASSGSPFHHFGAFDARFSASSND